MRGACQQTRKSTHRLQRRLWCCEGNILIDVNERCQHTPIAPQSHHTVKVLDVLIIPVSRHTHTHTSGLSNCCSADTRPLAAAVWQSTAAGCGCLAVDCSWLWLAGRLAGWLAVAGWPAGWLWLSLAGNYVPACVCVRACVSDTHQGLLIMKNSFHTTKVTYGVNSAGMYRATKSWNSGVKYNAYIREQIHTAPKNA